MPDPRQIAALKQYLKDRFNITTPQQLQERILHTAPIDISIFTKGGPQQNDNPASPNPRRSNRQLQAR